MRNVRAQSGREWDIRWKARDEFQFHWHLPQPPAELGRLLDEVELPPGGALDVGCGDGVVSWYLAQRFPWAVGLDISLAAVQQARTAGGGSTRVPDFVVGDARRLPFATSSMAFVFDRGCMHNLPREAYSDYLGEVARVLRPGGVFELFFAGRDAQMAAPSRRHLHAVRRKVSSLAGGKGDGPGRPGRLTAAAFADLLPTSMTTIAVAPSRFVSPTTHATVEFTHCVCRRGPETTAPGGGAGLQLAQSGVGDLPR